MRDSLDKGKYDFDINDGEEWFEIHSTAVTNTIPGSMVEVTINNERICENMTNREFREIIKSTLQRAIPLVDIRIAALRMWSPSERARVQRWFGRNDESARAILINGLPRIAAVLRGLSPANFVRSSPDRDKALGCTPNPLGASRRPLTFAHLIPLRIQSALAPNFVQCVTGQLMQTHAFRQSFMKLHISSTPWLRRIASTQLPIRCEIGRKKTPISHSITRIA